jgi:DDE superfamily endonuclease
MSTSSVSRDEIVDQCTHRSSQCTHQTTMTVASTLRKRILPFLVTSICSQTTVITLSAAAATRRPPEGIRLRTRFITRRRASVEEIYEELGELYWCKAYRMSYRSFNKLCWMLEDGIKMSSGKNNGTCRHYVNGFICYKVRLAIAIAYFAGARIYDLMTTYKVGYSDARKSIWYVTLAVNKYCEQLKIKYPTDHEEQRKIAAGFQRKSKAGFDGCAGCIDGVLIMMHCPTKHECEKTGVEAAKYFCARKNKYGLNLQAVCDASGKFLDLSITQGGASSDYMAFQTSQLRTKLDNNLLAPGLHLFGDNAYVNTPYMATPYTKVNEGSKDDYNFLHSNVRINIECSFGMFVHRWAFLRKAAPMNLSVAKIAALVMCMGKLHNFLIAEREEVAASLTPRTQLYMRLGNAITVDAWEDGLVPTDMLRAGHHFDNLSAAHRRAVERDRGIHAQNQELPRERMLRYVENNPRLFRGMH